MRTPGISRNPWLIFWGGCPVVGFVTFGGNPPNLGQHHLSREPWLRVQTKAKGRSSSGRWKVADCRNPRQGTITQVTFDQQTNQLGCLSGANLVIYLGKMDPLGFVVSCNVLYFLRVPLGLVFCSGEEKEHRCAILGFPCP